MVMSSGGHPGSQTTNIEDEMKTYSHMLVRKISGIAIGRYLSEKSALRIFRKKNSDRDPLEVREYSEFYWKQMA